MSQYAYDYNPAKTEDYRKSRISEDKFFDWSKENLYRSSYATSYTDKPQEPKNYAIPGYAGFIPGLKSRAAFGTNFASIAKESLSNPNLGANTTNLSSTGFNLKKELLADQTVTASSHKYGQMTMQKTHPSLNDDKWASQTQIAFSNPNTKTNPTYRPCDTKLVNPNPITNKSGYSANSITFDGKGFLPKEETNQPRIQTEYRTRYNGDKPVHVDTNSFHPRQTKPFKNPININKAVI